MGRLKRDPWFQKGEANGSRLPLVPASIAYGRAVLGREKMGSKLGQWWHLAGVGQQ